MLLHGYYKKKNMVIIFFLNPFNHKIQLEATIQCYLRPEAAAAEDTVGRHRGIAMSAAEFTHDVSVPSLNSFVCSVTHPSLRFLLTLKRKVTRMDRHRPLPHLSQNHQRHLLHILGLVIAALAIM